MEDRGLSDTQLFFGDKCLGLCEAINGVFPDSKYQCCIVHFYRNMFTAVPNSKEKDVAAMLKAIHAQEDLESVREKAIAVARKIRDIMLLEAARKLEAGIEDTLTYMKFSVNTGLKFVLIMV